MAATKRTKGEREADQEVIARLYLAGKTQLEIADAVNAGRPEAKHIGPRQISESLKGIREAWLDRACEDYDSHVARELARIDQLEREAWEAWERSKRTARTVRTKTSPVPPAPAEGQPPAEPPVETTVTEAEQVGDPRFLDKVGWCVETRVKMLGLSAPETSVLKGTGKDGAIVFTLDLGEKKLAQEPGGISGGGGHQPDTSQPS